MEKNQGLAARRLAGYKAKAANRVATIRANHGERAETVIANMRADDWRSHRYPKRFYGGRWQDAGKVSRPDSREYYIDSFADLGWREIGSAHDITARNGYFHNAAPLGWYCDAFQSETISGHVLQIPARNGVPQYVPAIAWSDCDGVTVWPLDRYDEPLDAARTADGYAESVAEDAREYSEAWQAGNEWSDLGDDIVSARKSALALLAEMRPLRKRGDGSPAICDALRAKVESFLDDIREARAKREELADNNRWRADAFNEGAGSQVIA